MSGADNLPFRAILNWWMCSDPWAATGAEHTAILAWIEAESRRRGYTDWVEAYHREPEVQA